MATEPEGIGSWDGDTIAPAQNMYVYFQAKRNGEMRMSYNFPNGFTPGRMGLVTLRGYAEAVAGWFGREANLRFLPYGQWAAGVDEKLAKITFDHIAHSPHCSIAKARRLLDYRPRYTSLEAVWESLQSLIDHGRVKVL